MDVPGTILMPTRYEKATLVDLLDRVFDKGVVIHADLLISVAGIPLLGVNLRAALAGMETMRRYGIMQDWDERARAWEREHAAERREPALQTDERVLLHMFGSHWYARGIYRAWQPGQLYLTNKRLTLFRAEQGELMNIALDEIRGLAVRKETRFTGLKRDLIYLSLSADKSACISAEKPEELVAGIRRIVEGMGLSLAEDVVVHPFRGEVDELIAGEEVVAEGRIWYQHPAHDLWGDTWRPGHLYLTDKRLLWWSDSDRQVQFEVALSRLVGAETETRELGGLIGERPILCLLYRNSHEQGSALFAGEDLAQWVQAIERAAGATETCPNCSEPAPREQLLQEGCRCCGWTSPLPSESPVAPGLPQAPPAIAARNHQSW
jgi:hypothetical protein